MCCCCFVIVCGVFFLKFIFILLLFLKKVVYVMVYIYHATHDLKLFAVSGTWGKVWVCMFFFGYCLQVFFLYFNYYYI